MRKPGRRRPDPFAAGVLAGWLAHWALSTALQHPETALPIVQGTIVALLILGAAGLTFNYIRHRRGNHMALLSKEQILSSDDRRYEVVSVPEWGGDVRLRSLTGRERDDFEARSLQGKGTNQTVNLKNVRARLVALCAVDGDGSLMFGPEDVMRLGQKNAAALARLYNKASELCGLSEDDVEELTKDFDETQDGASVTA